MALPQPLRAALQGLLDAQPDGVKQVVAHLPSDLQRVAQSPEGLLAILLSLALGALLLLAAAGGRRGKRGSTIVIAGPLNAGKSTLFYQLKDGSTHNGLVASMQENAAAVPVAGPKGGPAKTVRLLDMPGHHSFRHRLEAALREAAGVVFLVDAVDITPHRVEAAEALYEVLASPSFSKRRLPLLVAANKADLEEDAHSIEFVQKTLDKQLGAMRKTKAAGIGKDAAGGGGVAALGDPDKPFALASSLRSRVVFAECSAKAGSLDDVRAFIHACV